MKVNSIRSNVDKPSLCIVVHLLYNLPEHWSSCFLIFAGISRAQIQQVLNQDTTHFMQHPSFTNKPPLKPVNSYTPMERIQADLVDLSAVTVKNDKGSIYKYVLVVIDVFSRFLWLRPLEDKASASVAKELEEVFQTFGNPRILHTDNGGEFSGKVNKLCKTNGIKKVTGRANHPQTQGKVSRVHDHFHAIASLFTLNAGCFFPKGD